MKHLDAPALEQVLLQYQHQIRGPAPQDELIVLDGKEPHAGGGPTRWLSWHERCSMFCFHESIKGVLPGTGGNAGVSAGSSEHAQEACNPISRPFSAALAAVISLLPHNVLRVFCLGRQRTVELQFALLPLATRSQVVEETFCKTAPIIIPGAQKADGSEIHVQPSHATAGVLALPLQNEADKRRHCILPGGEREEHAMLAP